MAHLAAGADLQIAPGSIIGFALSGGSAKASLAGGLGKAEADIFQAGLYGSYTQGPVYVDVLAAYAYADNWMTRPIAVPGLEGLDVPGCVDATLREVQSWDLLLAGDLPGVGRLEVLLSDLRRTLASRGRG